MKDKRKNNITKELYIITSENRVKADLNCDSVIN